MEKLKAYWKSYTAIAVLIFLVWFFPSIQQKYYLERDFIRFSFNETLVITGIVFSISLISFYLFLYDVKDRFIRIAQSFAFSVFIGFIYAFVIQSIIISLGLFVNRLSDQDQISEKFEVTYVMKDGEVGIKSLEDGYFERTKNKFTQSSLETLKKGDTIQLLFQEGVFGKKYLDSGLIPIVE